MPYADPEKQKQQNKTYRDQNKKELDQYQRDLRIERRRKGLCVSCGHEKPCIACAARRKKYRAGREEKKTCQCGQPRAPRRKSCLACLEDKRNAWTSDQQVRLDGKLCWSCGETGTHQPVRNNARGRWRCDQCFFEQLALNWMQGSKRKARLLRDLWNRQGGKCVYTGEVLTATTASLDHIDPRNGERTREVDTSNLQFVTTTVNHMKHNLGHAEFLRMCALISGE